MEKLEELIKKYDELQKRELKIQKEKQAIRTEILRAMKKKKISWYRGEKLEAVYVVRRHLISLDKAKKFFGGFWKIVARRKIVYKINWPEIDRLIEEKKVSKLALEKILRYQEVLIVKKKEK